MDQRKIWASCLHGHQVFENVLYNTLAWHLQLEAGPSLQSFPRMSLKLKSLPICPSHVEMQKT